jgi:hypothetical protein
MWSLSELDRQRKYIIKQYENGAPCPICGKIQTPWEASGQDADTWATSGTSRDYHCIECGVELSHDVYFVAGWGWSSPAQPKAHR